MSKDFGTYTFLTITIAGMSGCTRCFADMLAGHLPVAYLVASAHVMGEAVLNQSASVFTILRESYKITTYGKLRGTDGRN